MSFQHESYPVAVAGQDGEGTVAPVVGVGPGGEQPLSRQVFIVQELEVRDRLASSQINKFLYLYTSESMPRRAHSNMVRQQGGRERENVIDVIVNWRQEGLGTCLWAQQLKVPFIPGSLNERQDIDYVIIYMILIVCFLSIADSESPAGVSRVWPRRSRVLSADQPAATTTQHRPGNSSTWN